MCTQVNENSFGTTVLCIDDYSNKILRGRIYNGYLNGGAEFNSTIELLLQLEQVMEENSSPQSFSVKRVFRTMQNQLPSVCTDDVVQHGKKATFSLRVLFRQNSSWQGSVIWCEGRRGESFRSVLELLLLIDSALSE